LKPTEIRNMTAAEIEHRLITLKEQFFNTRAEAVSGRMERPSRFRLLKRDIARCYTILKEKQSGKR